MMNYKEYFNLLKEYRIINPIYEYVLSLINDSFLKENNNEYLILFTIYFSLINDGNICMSLDKDTLKNKWNNKLDSTFTLLMSKNDINKDETKEKIDNLKKVSTQIIDNYLEKINSLDSLIGENKIFCIKDNYLYLNKYYKAKEGVINSIKRLFKDGSLKPQITIDKKYNEGEKTFELSEGQYKAASKGIENNLIITGGPGTGKTTSILFILLNILKKDHNYEIKLLAPSGKAASRMKESIINTLDRAFSENEKNKYKNELNILTSLEGSTIHKALEIDPSTSCFKRNKNNKFNKKTIFVIDESSMIDIELFNYLLEAIDDESKVFIMGDKNQLPSVDVGAVFADLLKKDSYLSNYVVEIDESKRFPNTSDIYKLANKVNNGELLDLKTDKINFKNYNDFEVIKDEIKDKSTPIYYYLDIDKEAGDKEIIKSITSKWFKAFYEELNEKSKDLDISDINYLKSLFKLSEESRILCCQNEGYRGINFINTLINKNIINHIKSNQLYYPGQLMIIKKNNKMLDLYNGDSGILVTFKDDPTLYLMVQKSNDFGTYKKDNIFTIDKFAFYPLRLITKEEIDSAYAITIHKSQGSDYNNILVILPKEKGNPLLNRQIFYTGITRTKQRTYILSNIDILNSAIENCIVRDTNIKF